MSVSNGSSKSLKSANFAWLCTLVTFDVAVLAIIIFPNIFETASVSVIAIVRSVSSVLLPIVPLLLANILPPIMKARLVFWRWKYPNPGSRAFTSYIHKDDRIDVEKLRKNIGAFPTDPKEQNARWYSLYQKVQNEIGVLDAHKSFLLYRDMASISLLLLIIVVAALAGIGLPWHDLAKVAAAFLVQYLLTAFSARSAGERFVCTVLSIHATQKIRAR